jgi:hypothetical protein
MTSNGKLMRTTDAGESWTELTLPDVGKGSTDMRFFWLMRAASGRLVVIASYFGQSKPVPLDSGHITLLTSDDHGATWITRIDTSGPRLYDAAMTPDGSLTLAYLTFNRGPSQPGGAHLAHVDPSLGLWNQMKWANTSRMVALNDEARVVTTHQRWDSTLRIVAMTLLSSFPPYTTADTIAQIPVSVSPAHKPYLMPNGSVIIHRDEGAFRWDSELSDSTPVSFPYTLTEPLCAPVVPTFSCAQVPGTSTLIHSGILCEDLAHSKDNGRTWQSTPTNLTFAPCCNEINLAIIAGGPSQAWIISGYYNDAWEWFPRLTRVDLDVSVVSVRNESPEPPSPSMVVERYDLIGRVVDSEFAGPCIEISINGAGVRKARCVFVQP